MVLKFIARTCMPQDKIKDTNGRAFTFKVSQNLQKMEGADDTDIESCSSRIGKIFESFMKV